MLRRLLILGLFCLLLANASVSANAANLGLQLWVEDPNHLGYALQSRWVSGVGLPDPEGLNDRRFALYLQEYANTGSGGVGADVSGLPANFPLTELGFDFRNDGHCGAGAPRFNVYTSVGVYYFFGCYYGTHTPAPADPSNWTRVRFGNSDAYPAQAAQPAWPGFGSALVNRIEVVFDEGLDVGPGFAYLDNFDISGNLITQPSKITGRVSTNTGAAIPYVAVTRTGSSTPEYTNSAGYYTFLGVPNGIRTLTPSLSGYAFWPPSRTVNVDGTVISGQNFTGGPARHITGHVATSGGAALVNVAVRLNGGPAVFTDNAGNYTHTVPSGSYLITATLAGYVFAPTSRSVAVGGSDVGGQDFTGSIAHSISGRIATSSGAAMAGVKVTRSGSTVPAYTNSAGYYLFGGLADGTYTITPNLSGTTFSPASRSVTVNNANVAGQNFVGS